MLEAVHGCQHADNAKNSNGNAKKRKKSAQLILPQFLHGHFETADNYFQCAAHDTNLVEGFEPGYDFIYLVTGCSFSWRRLLRRSIQVSVHYLALPIACPELAEGPHNLRTAFIIRQCLSLNFIWPGDREVNPYQTLRHSLLTGRASP
jgi:hypothetical protein